MKSALFAAACFALAAAGSAPAATVLTGDRIDGAAVIEKLDVADLPAGQVSKFWFRVEDTSLGQGWYVPVIVIKGAKPGPKFLVTAGIHGDELTGIAVIQQLAQETDPKTLSGTLIMVPGLNTPGLLHSTRGLSVGALGQSGTANLNRLMPGDPAALDVGERYAGRLWSQIFTGNADFAVDFHTQSRGAVYPAYVFAQTHDARVLADLLCPDIINMDPGIDGALENMLDNAGVPAVTYELGGAEVFDTAMTARALTGLRNIMKGKGMIAGTPDLSAPAPFVGNSLTNVDAPRGGWAHVMVKIGDDVKAGQTVATITDPFGAVTAALTAPHDGHVLSLASDPRADVGDMVVRLITWDDALPCKADGCPAGTPMPAN
ncbi:MAG: succinylglutamate desuccinylase/aspartoacylase family protein [Asticcacaulis sp.]